MKLLVFDVSGEVVCPSPPFGWSNKPIQLASTVIQECRQPEGLNCQAIPVNDTEMRYIGNTGNEHVSQKFTTAKRASNRMSSDDSGNDFATETAFQRPEPGVSEPMPKPDFGATVPMSFDAIETSRLIPRVSFRSLFALTTLMAVIYAVAKSAEEGTAAAVGILVMLGYLVAMLALFMVLYCVAWAFAVLLARRDTDVQEGSPFASDQLPPQWIAPQEKEA